MTLSLTFAAIGAVVTIFVALREHGKGTAARRTLLDRCAGLFSTAMITHGGDGFPRLEGYRNGQFTRIELVPDNMTIRRLPQLWLKLTRLDARPARPEFSVLVRPSGAEFYSLTEKHSRTLEPPPGLGQEVIAKGDCAASQAMLDAAAPQLQRLFSDPRMKEVGVTRKGLRLIWQAAEGHRGEHLIFRQCRFEDAAVAPEVLAALLANLDAVGSAIDDADEARAA
jgi:hypothetical protein